MTYLTVKNWELFQHYRDRHPPWIKLHARVLNDRDFMVLSRASRGLLMLLWILASENEGQVPYSQEEIRFRLRLEDFVLEELTPLISGGFLIPDEDCKQALADASGCSRSTLLSVVSTGSTKEVVRGFVRPSVEDVAARIKERGYHFSAEGFVAYYSANGWKVGRNPMKDWKAACTTWEERWKSDHPGEGVGSGKPGVFGKLPQVPL